MARQAGMWLPCNHWSTFCLVQTGIPKEAWRTGLPGLPPSWIIQAWLPLVMWSSVCLRPCSARCAVGYLFSPHQDMLIPEGPRNPINVAILEPFHPQPVPSTSFPQIPAYTASMRRRLVFTAYFKVKMKLISHLTSKPKSLKKQKPNKTFCCESITPSQSLCKSTGSCRSLTMLDPMSTETIMVQRLNRTLLFQPWKLLAWQSLLGSKHTCLINYKYGMNHRENSHLPMNMIQV